ncbi:50S ribosomal protein L29 [Anaerobacillus sp. HL2]|nr:50S ribosomal protein L29 [Anaerobacillus sp. HL2]
MKANEIRNLTTAEIEQKAKSLKELFNLRFQLATGQLDNPARIREAPLVQTVLRERES